MLYLFHCDKSQKFAEIEHESYIIQLHCSKSHFGLQQPPGKFLFKIIHFISNAILLLVGKIRYCQPKIMS